MRTFTSIDASSRHAELMRRAAVYSVGGYVLDFAKRNTSAELCGIMSALSKSVGISGNKSLLELLKSNVHLASSEIFWRCRLDDYLVQIDEGSKQFFVHEYVSQSRVSESDDGMQRLLKNMHERADKERDRADKERIFKFNCDIFVISSLSLVVRESLPSRSFLMKSLGIGFFERIRLEALFK